MSSHLHMPSWLFQPEFSRGRYFLAVALIGAVLWTTQKCAYYVYYQKYQANTVLSSTPGFPSGPAAPTEWQKMQLNTEGGKISQLINLAMALIGGIGWLMVNARKELKSAHVQAAFLAALFAGVSIYYGFLCQGFVQGVFLNYQTFNPYDSMYSYLTSAQFVTLILAAVFFTDFARLDLMEKSPL